MEEEITIIEPTRYAQFSTIEAYNAVNVAIANYNNIRTNNEYNRTGTKYEYAVPEPINNYYYMPAEPQYVKEGLFEGIELLDTLPTQMIELPRIEWLKVDIQNWMDDETRQIAYNISDTKQQLIDKIHIHFGYDPNELS